MELDRALGPDRITGGEGAAAPPCTWMSTKPGTINFFQDQRRLPEADHDQPP